MPLRLRLPLLLTRPAPAAAARPRRRTARPAVLSGLAAFVGLQLGVGVTSDLRVKVRDPLYGDKFARLERRLTGAPTKPATVVMLGSSRTGLAFHGKRVEAAVSADLGRPAVAFNFGVPASGPVTHLVYLNRLLDSGVKPDLLLVEILPSMLADGHGGPVERHWFYADRVRLGEVDTLTRHGFPAAATEERYARSVLLPASALRFQLLSRVIPSWLPWQVRFDWSRGADDCGWGTTQSQFIDSTQRADMTARAKAEYSGILGNLTPGGGAADALRELLAVCRDRGIPVRLVLMPEGSLFRSWYPLDSLARLHAFLAAVSAEYSAPLVDAQSWLPDDAFYDQHHMFAAGAEAFSDRLARQVVAPALRSRPPGGDAAGAH